MNRRRFAALYLLGLLVAPGWLALASSCTSAKRVIGIPPAPTSIRFRGELLAFLDRLHAEYSVEEALCLTGRVRGSTVHVDGLQVTRIHSASQHAVVFEVCEQPSVVGRFHNHPSGHCSFSDLDALFQDRDPRALVALVSCGDGRFAWRIRGSAEPNPSYTSAPR